MTSPILVIGYPNGVRVRILPDGRQINSNGEIIGTSKIPGPIALGFVRYKGRKSFFFSLEKAFANPDKVKGRFLRELQCDGREHMQGLTPTDEYDGSITISYLDEWDESYINDNLLFSNIYKDVFYKFKNKKKLFELIRSRVAYMFRKSDLLKGKCLFRFKKLKKLLIFLGIKKKRKKRKDSLVNSLMERKIDDGTNKRKEVREVKKKKKKIKKKRVIEL